MGTSDLKRPSQKSGTFIINPTGGGGRCGRWFVSIQKELQETLGPGVGPCTFRMTEFPGHACDLAREATLAGVDIIVAVGGDGTLSEVVNGIMSAGEERTPDERPALACMPAGTGSDFARTWGWSQEWRHACHRINAGRLVAVDVGLLSCVSPTGEPLRRFFLNEATCGVVAHSLRFVRPFKRFGAFLGYMLAGAIGVLTYLDVACRVKFDGGEWTTAPHLTALSAANGRYLGGGLQFSPLADVTDGLLSVVLVEDFSVLRFARHIHRIRAGRHIQGLGRNHKGNTGGCSAHAAQSVEVEVVGVPGVVPEVAVEADGELLGHLPAKFTILSGALRIIT